MPMLSEANNLLISGRGFVRNSGSPGRNLRSFALLFCALFLCGGDFFSRNTTVADEKSPAKTVPASINALPVELQSEGWVRLFDGETTFGWHPTGNSTWVVKDGALTCTSTEPAFLMSHVEFGDFELMCDFRLSKGGNSGLFLRTLASPANPVTDCYELNICDSHPQFPSGSLVGVVLPEQPVSVEENWHSYHVTCIGNRIQVSLDGKSILDFTDIRPAARKRGFLGLQHRGGVAEYRRIFLKPLGMSTLLNGRDLDGWRQVPGGTSTFTVNEGLLNVRGGRGFVETTATFADFALQADVFTNSPGLNSGIFFRAMPGTAEAPSNGYECQIHNLFEAGDRSRPVDFGTGGIYRRVKARKVVSNDNEWTSLTVIATGPNIQTWVNGEPVVAWTDTRSPKDNPREGLRTAAGHLSLQGHDPTTDIDFKNIRVGEIPAAGKPAPDTTSGK